MKGAHTMKKLVTLILMLAVCASTAAPAFASDYSFGSGPSSDETFGHETSTDEPVSTDPMSENERRNKDNSALPPPYFYGSGDIPTEPSSPYHDNTHESGFAPEGQQYPPTGGEGFLPSTSQTAAAQTVPWFYDDGSIGTLNVASTGKTVRVFEGEDLSNLQKGAGHFASTSAWDGNVCMAGHNRGSWPFFSFVKDLRTGDRITYTTMYGTRIYEVFSKEQINEMDYSKLGWSADNMLTLVTCIENTPALRWAAQLREVS
jgi:sortase A